MSNSAQTDRNNTPTAAKVQRTEKFATYKYVVRNRLPVGCRSFVVHSEAPPTAFRTAYRELELLVVYYPY